MPSQHPGVVGRDRWWGVTRGNARPGGCSILFVHNAAVVIATPERESNIRPGIGLVKLYCDAVYCTRWRRGWDPEGSGARSPD